MNLKNLFQQAITELESAGVGTARLDALVLLEDVLGIDRARLLAEPEMEISTAQQAQLTKLLKRRAGHEPLAYIRGRAEFYGREFVLTSAVLQPRPESETMIDLLKNLSGLPARPRLADVGTGSGALGITAALELPSSRIELLEIDPLAIKVAQINVDKLTPGIKILESDLLSHSQQQNDVLLCNLPYVPDGFQINLAARHEPKIAIFGGPDGLDLYRRLLQQIQKLAKKPLFILTEALPPQHKDLALIADSAGYKLQQTEGFIQAFKVA